MGVAENLLHTLKSLCSLLNDEQIDYCLIGGLAVAILAKPRATEDIDLLIFINEEKIPSLIRILEKRFTIVQKKNVMHFPDATICRTVLGRLSNDTTGIVVVDFLLADRDLYWEALRNPIFLSVNGEKIPIARPKSLIELKKISNRPQDLLDIESLEEALKDQAEQ